ncbi:30S ribosomal protein S20 [Silvanigrella paludirubra]|uniref:Small ribosomal subunit protein bS20 n=1 Tax=Silvanigrella paludirubra TaxID=2499159 RepID=A0A6N6VPK4_9BACT|nr:30S ribosomal protein S20 [Silvanigrella paludirubra]KAB8036876.1 30S ribosomal protein S20 [Silvanigrella paludirubra]
MANHVSSEKRARQTEVRRLRNRANMSTMKTSVKKVLDAVQKKDFSQIDALLRDAQSAIAKTRQKGTIHKNNMARRISRLNAFVNKARKA